MFDVQVDAIEAADDPAEVVEVVAAVPKLPAFLADQVTRDRVGEGEATGQPEGERGPGAIR
jgi:hypothetical protein